MIDKETFSSSSESCETFSSLDPSDLNTNCFLASPVNYQNITLTRVLNKAKFPVLLGALPSSDEHFAVKLFPYHEGKVNRCYTQETLFANLKHPNIASVLHCQHEREMLFDDCCEKVSYIIMEFAPYGDFCDLVISKKIQIDDKLARTYFHQVVEGVEYLHSAGVAHLDLKLENLLIGKNYNLKICDFDQAYLKGQEVIFSRGTENYRAPELYRKGCQDLQAADIYSLGIILFALKCEGILPYCENEKIQGFNMFDLLTQDIKVFWKEHCKIQNKKSSFFTKDFKMLFESMVAIDPAKRPTTEQIKRSRWYNGPIYSQEEVEIIMQKM